MVKFWTDVWIGDYPLAVTYPYLYELCSNRNILLKDMISSQGLAVKFPRFLTGVNRFEWEEVLHIIHSFHPDQQEDHLVWDWASKGSFTVKSMYHFLHFGGVKELCGC